MDRRSLITSAIGVLAGVSACGSSASEKATPLSAAEIQERVERLRLASLFVGAGFDKVEFTMTTTKNAAWSYYEPGRGWVHGVTETHNFEPKFYTVPLRWEETPL